MADAYLIGGGGVDIEDATATEDKVLAGSTFYSGANDDIRTGSMANNGAIDQSISAGATYIVPAGYHIGTGMITATSLASQTGGATATDDKVLSGNTYWKDGVKRTGTLTVSSILNFKIAMYSSKQVIGTWQNPTTGLFSGVMVRYDYNGAPLPEINSGNLAYEGSNNSFTLSLSGTYYNFRAWSYVNTSGGKVYRLMASYHDVEVTEIKGMETITASRTFTVPDKVYSLDVFCVGGGGSGQLAGGGGGRTSTKKGYSVEPGQIINVTVASGGTSGYGGGTTTVATNATNVLSATGGEKRAGQWSGGNGGSGGGAHKFNTSERGAHGGSDGGDGGYVGQYGGNLYVDRGIGQGRTTRAFGEAGNTLYAGGGGGGGEGVPSEGRGPGSGGAGGGGAAGFHRKYPNNATVIDVQSGTPGTGGGGGGVDYDMGYNEHSGAGGSGVVLIRWGYSSSNKPSAT